MITLTPFERELHRALLGRVRNVRGTDPESALTTHPAVFGSDHSPRGIDPESVVTTYVALGQEVDPEGASTFPMTKPPFRGLNEALGHVSMYEVEHGRPMLSALVVNADTRKPGDGFAKLARHLGLEAKDDDDFWRSELGRVVEFWSADDLVLVLDAALDRVMEQLSDIKAALRRVT